jgi:hypothetical protein
MAAAALAERGASREIARRDDEAARKRDLARTEVLEESGNGAASWTEHLRTIAR